MVAGGEGGGGVVETHPALPQTTMESLLLLGIVDGVPGGGGVMVVVVRL